ncbi:MAG: exodeoxyribonuclease VII small subunit [Tannerella sp.]|jgi:exodeoxyribonuclease VII small subunit|nr:exodeoxyribonuclease VII small subunit [Tannerella sp.]
MSEKTNYAEAFEELKKIVASLEQGNVSVDELSEKVERASLLIKICKAKLSETGEKVHQILKEIDESAVEQEA